MRPHLSQKEKLLRRVTATESLLCSGVGRCAGGQCREDKKNFVGSFNQAPPHVGNVKYLECGLPSSHLMDCSCAFASFTPRTVLPTSQAMCCMYSVINKYAPTDFKVIYVYDHICILGKATVKDDHSRNSEQSLYLHQKRATTVPYIL